MDATVQTPRKSLKNAYTYIENQWSMHLLCWCSFYKRQTVDNLSWQIQGIFLLTCNIIGQNLFFLLHTLQRYWSSVTEDSKSERKKEKKRNFSLQIFLLAQSHNLNDVFLLQYFRVIVVKGLQMIRYSTNLCSVTYDKKTDLLAKYGSFENLQTS